MLTTALVLAACGSQLDPDEVVGLSQQGATVAPDGTIVDGTDDGTDPGTDTGTDPVTDTGTGTGTDTSTDPGTDDGDDPAQPPGVDNDPDSGVKAGSCDGFDNDQPGITEDTIQLVNVADISGPVPGIFESAQQGTRAFLEYFNSTEDICGHKLALDLLDSRADAAADQQAYTTACDNAFAAVGSMGAFDSGGAQTAENCGLPDIRSTSTAPERNQCNTCYSAQAVTPNLIPSAVPKFFMSKYKDATEAVGVLYINAGSAAPNAKFQKNAWVKAGWKVPYFQGIDVAEFNFAPYVQQMKDKGVKMVVYTGPYQNTVKIQQAMQQQNFDPIFMQDSTIYDQGYIDQAGSLSRRILRLLDDRAVHVQQPRDEALPGLARPGQPRRQPELLRHVRLVGDPALRAGGGRPGRQAQPADAARRDVEGQGLDQQRHARAAAGGRQDHGRVLQDLPGQRRDVEAGLRRRLPLLPAHQRRLRD